MNRLRSLIANTLNYFRRGKIYKDWEEICMLYYLLKTNTVDKWNSEKNWALMKINYQVILF